MKNINWKRIWIDFNKQIQEEKTWRKQQNVFKSLFKNYKINWTKIWKSFNKWWKDEGWPRWNLQRNHLKKLIIEELKQSGG